MKQKPTSTEPIVDPTAILSTLVALKDITIDGYLTDKAHHILIISCNLTPDKKRCPQCSTPSRIHSRPSVDLTDLLCFNRPVIIRWRKHRMHCPNTDCPTTTWTIKDPRIASHRARMTTRAAKWAVKQINKQRTYSSIATELGCDWHTVARVANIYGPAWLEADAKRVSLTTAIGLDETAYLSHRANNYRGTAYVTTVCDLNRGTVIDIAPGRDWVGVAELLAKQPKQWRDNIRFGTLDLSPIYRKVYRYALPNATLIADPFHVVKKAGERMDEVRRRVQWETTGHRGRKEDPLFRVRRRLLVGAEKFDKDVIGRILSILDSGDPSGELTLAWRMKESVREVYRLEDKQQAVAKFDEVVEICSRRSSPVELRQLAKTLNQWRDEILAYLDHKFSNGPTEGLNNRIKKIKRDGFGFRNFENYRLRILLALGGANPNVLNSIVIP